MTNWDLAKTLHEQVGLNYEYSLAYYREHGYIYSSPNSLVWAEVWKEDTWLVYLAIGNMREFLLCMPFYLPHYCFCRLLRKDHRMKTRSVDRLANLLGINVNHLKSRKLQ